MQPSFSISQRTNYSLFNYHISLFFRKDSSLCSLLDTIFENGEKVLIFTQYKEMGELLLQLMKEYYPVSNTLFFHGELSTAKREDIVDKFQNKNHCRAMILTLKAGGTGLNLTAATNVIHYDMWWNPGKYISYYY